MVMESATVPIPSEVILPLAGYYLVYLGHLNFWLVVIVASIGSLLGTLIDYTIGYYLGRAAIVRYGRTVRLNEEHLKTAEGWFKRHGNAAVLLARFVPLIRTLIVFPAGIGEMNLAKFIGYSIVGIFAWNDTHLRRISSRAELRRDSRDTPELLLAHRDPCRPHRGGGAILQLAKVEGKEETAGARTFLISGEAPRALFMRTTRTVDGLG